MEEGSGGGKGMREVEEGSGGGKWRREGDEGTLVLRHSENWSKHLVHSVCACTKLTPLRYCTIMLTMR